MAPPAADSRASAWPVKGASASLRDAASCTLDRPSRCTIPLLTGVAPTGEPHGGEAMNETTETVELVGEHAVPVDPMDGLECDSCQ